MFSYVLEPPQMRIGKGDSSRFTPCEPALPAPLHPSLMSPRTLREFFSFIENTMERLNQKLCFGRLLTISRWSSARPPNCLGAEDGRKPETAREKPAKFRVHPSRSYPS